ncbi:hypothetical protein ABEF93_004202 [Exophiala dermatitidis]
MSKRHVLVADKPNVHHADIEHSGSQSTFFRRWFALITLKTTARFYRHHGPCCPISRHLIVKTSPFVDLTEAATMNFIKCHTSIPVPRIYCSFIHDNQVYIVMERIRGKTLAEAFGSLAEADLTSICTQLRQMLLEMRKLCPPGPGVQSCTGGSLRDSRNPRSNPRFGPFKSIQEFHLWLREGLKAEQPPCRQNIQEWREAQDMIAMQDEPYPPLVFTHGDLNPFNILVRGAQLVGIVDWEFSGWYPHYWEYTSAWCGNRTREAWQKAIPKFLEPDPDHLKMEITRQKWWGEF